MCWTVNYRLSGIVAQHSTKNRPNRPANGYWAILCILSIDHWNGNKITLYYYYYYFFGEGDECGNLWIPQKWQNTFCHRASTSFVAQKASSSSLQLGRNLCLISPNPSLPHTLWSSAERALAWPPLWPSEQLPRHDSCLSCDWSIATLYTFWWMWRSI